MDTQGRTAKDSTLSTNHDLFKVGRLPDYVQLNIRQATRVGTEPFHVSSWIVFHERGRLAARPLRRLASHLTAALTPLGDP